MKTRIFSFVMIAAFLLLSCSKKNSASDSSSFDPWNVPQGAVVAGVTLSDGWTDLRELTSPVAVSGGWTDSAAITPSGLHLYFAYTTLNFGLFQDSSGATQTYDGPTRPGMTGGHFKMFRADLSGAGWSVNYLPFNGDPNVHEASMSPNAAEDFIVFTRFDASGVGTLFYTSYVNGTWSTPAAFPTSPAINTPTTTCTNDNAFVIGSLASGYTLYWESNRADLAGTSCRGDGKSRLYMATYSQVPGFTGIQEVPGLDGSTSGESDTQLSVSQDKSKVYFTRASDTVYGVFTGDWIGSAYANVHQIVTPNFASPFTGKLVMVGEANVAATPGGSLLYMMCGIGTSEAGAQHTPRITVCVAKKPN